MHTGLVTFDIRLTGLQPGVYLLAGDPNSGLTSFMLSMHREALLRGNNSLFVDGYRTSPDEELFARAGGELVVLNPYSAEHAIDVVDKAACAQALITLDSLDTLAVASVSSLIKNSLFENAALSRLLVYSVPRLRATAKAYGSVIVLSSEFRNGNLGKQSVHLNYLGGCIDGYITIELLGHSEKYGVTDFRRIRLREHFHGVTYTTKTFLAGINRGYELMRACLEYGLVKKQGGWFKGDILEEPMQNSKAAFDYFNDHYDVIYGQLCLAVPDALLSY